MGFSVSSRSRYQFKSVSLRTNEEFVRLYNDVKEARHLEFQNSRVLDDSRDFWLWPLRSVVRPRAWEWERFENRVKDVDQLMKRAEKNAKFSEVLSGIMLQFEQKIFPTLRSFHADFEAEDLFLLSKRYEYFELEYLLQDLLEVFAESVSSGLELANKVVVSALVLLSFVYQYLIGCVDKGGSKTYSPGSFLFRLIFVAIVLFLGSYVWIKSRQASFTANRRKRKSCQLASQLGDQSHIPEGVYRRAVKDTRGSVTHYKDEPRLKPRREKLESGTSLEFNHLSLGSYDTPRGAEIVRHIAAVLYGKEEGRPVQFEDGLCLPFPSVTEPENCPPSGKEKAVWVTHKTKELYAELLRGKASRLQLLHPAVETVSHHDHDGEASRSDPSPSTPGAPSIAIELTCFTSPHGVNGVVEQPTTSESHGLGQEALLAREFFSSLFSDSDFEQGFSSMPQLEENDFPAMDDLDKVDGDYSEADYVFVFESTLVPPQSSALDSPASAIFASLPQLGGGDRDLEIIEPRLNSASAITFPQLESLPEQVQLQQHVTCQEKRPEEFLGSNIEMQQKLLESEVRNTQLQWKLRKSEVGNSELQQKLRKAEVENEKWRSMFHQVAKLMSASNLDGDPVDIQ